MIKSRGDEEGDLAKDLLQMFLERAGDQPRRFVRIGGLDVEPVDEQRVALDVDDQRTGRQRDRIGKRQSADRRFQRGLDLDDAWREIDARRIDIAQHIDVGRTISTMKTPI